jgi:glycosyltransferase involved in cell wall biosynthesis
LGGYLLRATHVLGGLSARYGGPSYSVPRLCEALAASGVDTTLLSVGEGTSSKELLGDGRFKDRRFSADCANWPILRTLRMSFDLSRVLRENASCGHVIHNHGLWLMPNVDAGVVTKRCKTPLIVAPRGMLAPVALAFSSRKKKLFWKLLQGPAIQHASCFHATSEQEYGEIRNFGIRNPVAVIPNGIDLPRSICPGQKSEQRIVLTLGRIHPKKGLDRLLHAWSRVESRQPDWRLRIIGPGEDGHDTELRALAANLELARVSIEPPIYNDAKTDAFQEADLFVLPSLNENFGLTVAESLAAGTPVIATKGAPWSKLEREHCGWWIDSSVDSLTEALGRAMALSGDDLREMGARGRAWMARDFGWESVAEKTKALYLWVSTGAVRPSFVYPD